MMRLPRVRFTVRRMMIAVGVMALLIAGSIQSLRWNRVSREHAKRVAVLLVQESRLRALILEDETRLAEVSMRMEELRRKGDNSSLSYQFAKTDHDMYSRFLGMARKAANQSIVLRLKHQSAIYRPWLPVAPDPPEPE
jgi:hypothetical protein